MRPPNSGFSRTTHWRCRRTLLAQVIPGAAEGTRNGAGGRAEHPLVRAVLGVLADTVAGLAHAVANGGGGVLGLVHSGRAEVLHLFLTSEAPRPTLDAKSLPLSCMEPGLFAMGPPRHVRLKVDFPGRDCGPTVGSQTPVTTALRWAAAVQHNPFAIIADGQGGSKPGRYAVTLRNVARNGLFCAPFPRFSGSARLENVTPRP